MTAEQLYNLYHQLVFKAEKGIIPRPVKDFTKAKARIDWIYFEKLSSMIERTNGHINPELLIQSLVEFFKGRFPAKMLIHPKGLKIYKAYRQEQDSLNDSNLIREKVLKSLQFVVNFMKNNNIKTLDEYLTLNSIMIPDIAIHLCSGQISKHFFAIIPNIEQYVNKFSPDIKAEYFSNIEEWLPRMRMFVGRDDKLRKLSANLQKVIHLTVE